MAEFVRKNAVGLYRETKDGYSDPECTHVVLSKKEYDKLNDDIDFQKKIARDTETAAKKRLSELVNEANSKIETAKENANSKIEVAEQELAEARKEIEYQKKLNGNLLRIAKERANSDRKLKPKKSHTGYVVISSRETEYRYKEDKRHWNKAVLWETVLQSPYTVEFTEEQAREQIRELFKKDENDSWIIGKIGIVAKWFINYEDMLDTQEYQKEFQYLNTVIRQQLRANYITGYWEVILQHTKSLENVPKDMMRCSYV